MENGNLKSVFDDLLNFDHKLYLSVFGSYYFNEILRIH